MNLAQSPPLDNLLIKPRIDMSMFEMVSVELGQVMCSQMGIYVEVVIIRFFTTELRQWNWMLQARNC